MFRTMLKKLSVTNLSLENNLLTFQLNALVVIRAKVPASYFRAQVGNR